MNDKHMDNLMESVEKWLSDEIEIGRSEEEIIDKFDKTYFTELSLGIIDVSAEMYCNNFESNARVIIENSERGDEEFYRKFIDKWGKALRLSKIMYYMCKEILQSYQRNQGNSFLMKSLSEIYIRGCQVYLEVITLVSAGLADGAWARWRTLYELGVLSQFIAENGEEAGEKFYKHKDSKNYYDWARSLPCFEGYPEENYITFNAIFNKCKHKNRHWKKTYESASIAIHACTEGTLRRFGNYKKVATGIGPEMYGIDTPAIYAAESIGIISLNYLGEFKDLNSRIMLKLIHKWIDLLKDHYSRIQ